MLSKSIMDAQKLENSSSDALYTVQPGDTLAGISLKISVTVPLLKKYNHLFGKNDIYVGQVLIFMKF